MSKKLKGLNMSGFPLTKNFIAFLFALYLNDLEKFFIQNVINSLEKVETLCADN
jgi:hypothetical protein